MENLLNKREFRIQSLRHILADVGLEEFLASAAVAISRTGGTHVECEQDIYRKAAKEVMAVSRELDV